MQCFTWNVLVALPLMGKECPGPKHCDLSFEAEIKHHTEQQRGGNFAILLQDSSKRNSKQQLIAADHVAPAVCAEDN